MNKNITNHFLEVFHKNSKVLEISNTACILRVAVHKDFDDFMDEYIRPKYLSLHKKIMEEEMTSSFGALQYYGSRDWEYYLANGWITGDKPNSLNDVLIESCNGLDWGFWWMFDHVIAGLHWEAKKLDSDFVIIPKEYAKGKLNEALQYVK